jgi:hypothetical protein
MTPEERYADVVTDLSLLNVPVPRTDVDHLTEAVMTRVARRPLPDASRSRSSRRRVVLAAIALLLALVATPPVRATVADWFGFAGVLVRTDGQERDPAPGPPSVATGAGLRDAAAAVDFPLLLPRALGRPDAVQVSADHRLVSMTWSGPGSGTIRLDQFDGRLDFTMAKQSPGVEFTTVSGADALWFSEPHEVVLLGPEGERRTEAARLAGHTLIWPRGDTTLRLEGDLTRARAVLLAQSAGPVG